MAGWILLLGYAALTQPTTLCARGYLKSELLALVSKGFQHQNSLKANKHVRQQLWFLYGLWLGHHFDQLHHAQIFVI